MIKPHNLKKVNKLKVMLGLSALKKGDITTATQVIFDAVDDIDTRVKESVDNLDARAAAIKEGRQGIEGKIGPRGFTGSQGKGGSEGRRSYVPGPIGPKGKDAKEINEKKVIIEVLQKIPTPKDGIDGDNGSSDNPLEIAKKLNSLKGVINASVIKDLPTVYRESPVITLFGGQGRARGSKVKDISAGTNITITKSPGGVYTITATGGGGGASELSDLSDVHTSTPTDKNVLVADGVDWESRALVEADISDLGSYQTADAALTSISGLTYVSGSFIALTAENVYAVRTYAQVLSDIGAAPALGADDNYVTDAEKTVIGNTSGSNTGDQDLSGKADVDQTMYIGTTAVVINRGTAALTLAEITLTTPDIGTPTAGVLTSCTGLPAASVVAGSLVANMLASDHGTAATDQIVNVSYGTGDPPAANTTTIGSLYVKYTA